MSSYMEEIGYAQRAGDVLLDATTIVFARRLIAGEQIDVATAFDLSVLLESLVLHDRIITVNPLPAGAQIELNKCRALFGEDFIEIINIPRKSYDSSDLRIFELTRHALPHKYAVEAIPLPQKTRNVLLDKVLRLFRKISPLPDYLPELDKATILEEASYLPIYEETLTEDVQYFEEETELRSLLKDLGDLQFPSLYWWDTGLESATPFVFMTRTFDSESREFVTNLIARTLFYYYLMLMLEIPYKPKFDSYEPVRPQMQFYRQVRSVIMG